jgi:hypothetical protein
MELLHRYSGLKVSVVYRVPDGLNGLNGLNCLNEQRLIGRAVCRLDEGFSEPRSQSDPRKMETESKIRKWFRDLIEAKYLREDLIPDT